MLFFYAFHVQLFFFRVRGVEVAMDVDVQASASDGTLNHIDFFAQIRASLPPTDAASHAATG